LLLLSLPSFLLPSLPLFLLSFFLPPFLPCFLCFFLFFLETWSSQVRILHLSQKFALRLILSYSFILLSHPKRVIADYRSSRRESIFIKKINPVFICFCNIAEWGSKFTPLMSTQVGSLKEEHALVLVINLSAMIMSWFWYLTMVFTNSHRQCGVCTVSSHM
jgi:hypothetical protein